MPDREAHSVNMLNRLLMHVHAVMTKRKLNAERTVCHSRYLVDRKRYIWFHNGGKHMPDNGSFLHITGNKLICANPSVEEALKQAFNRLTRCHSEPRSSKQTITFKNASGETIAIIELELIQTITNTSVPNSSAPTTDIVPPDLYLITFSNGGPSKVTLLKTVATQFALTQAESEVLFLIAEGYTTKKIASLRCVGTETVKHQIKSIFTKLDCSNRTTLLAKILTLMDSVSQSYASLQSLHQNTFSSNKLAGKTGITIDITRK